MPNSDDGLSPIESRKVLLGEGKDEVNFLGALLRHMNILDVHIDEGGGKNRFPEKLVALKKARGFFGPSDSCFVSHFAVIRDKNGDDAFRSVANTLKKEGFTPPPKPGTFSDANPKVGIFIMPGETIEGTMLEDLCLETVKEQPAMKCVEEFSSCVSSLDSPPKNISKAKAQVFKAQVFLATQPDFVDSVGLGAQKGYWDFESPFLTELKAFLSHLK